MKNQKEQHHLVKQAVEGDADAFSRLLESCYHMIYRLAFRVTANADDAEDTTQDVCLGLARTLHTFRMESSFTTWLYRITLNAAYDRCKKNKKYVAFDDTIHQHDGGKKTQEQHMDERRLWHKVHLLPKKQREAVLLVYGEDLHHEDVAAIMNCATGTVSWYIHQAKQTLRSLLEHDERP